jgi:hypothetical protein
VYRYDPSDRVVEYLMTDESLAFRRAAVAEAKGFPVVSAENPLISCARANP